MPRRWMRCEIIIVNCQRRCKFITSFGSPDGLRGYVLRYSNTLETSLAALNQEHVGILVRHTSLQFPAAVLSDASMAE